MKKQFYRFLIPSVLCGAIFASCSKDKDVVQEENDEEVITTMKVNVTPVGSTNTTTFEFRDQNALNGAKKDVITLAPNTTYNVTIELWNESESDPEDVTEEVKEEARAHRFYFEPDGANITVSNLNTDPDGIPLGVESVWETGAAANGKIKITLRHYPGNPPGKSADDTVTSNKSGTDIQVEFDTAIE